MPAHHRRSRALWGPASENLQGTKPRVCQLLPSTTLLARLQQGRCYRGPIYVGFEFPIGLPKAYAERTALRWPKIPLVSASLKCEVRTVGTSLMPKSFAAATRPWFGPRGNDCDNSHLAGVLR